MREKNWSFQQALETAQALGYAESDPTFDIQGIDAAHKASIMAAIAFGIRMPFQSAYIEGIAQLQSQDIGFAEQLGYRIKLLGITKQAKEGIELRIHPCLVPANSIIANVEGAMNAVMVQADAVGTTLYYGKGAGGEPTASAIIADLVDITRLHTADPINRVPHLAFQPQAIRDVSILSMDQVVTAYYLRLGVADQAGVLDSVTGLLAQFNISIDAMLQQASLSKEERTELIILTHQCLESSMNAALHKIQALPTVIDPIIRIRKEELI
jgi:homoserine dehydrogenase